MESLVNEERPQLRRELLHLHNPVGGEVEHCAPSDMGNMKGTMFAIFNDTPETKV